ncbi:thioredoxin-disulfide reductase [Nitrolancea hollandica]|uniref:Thioredoxin reductase n=1 Tax=Nitrolancea hollandica Lb TaxID=1129897 RepID=I4EK54_9BACT|nr:thioredoxin-disulfide reductase [Nitrolancea hollandica]CCF85066.1 thioredoxin reductase, FAD/NAD(P)-binding [Nitrolancea hollandica Lb]
MQASENHRQVIIIGSGPAGYTAAIYTARAALRPLVLGGFTAGGQLMLTSDVENYPGYPEGVQGPEMMRDFRAQAERFGADVLDVDVTSVDFSQRPFVIEAEGTTYTAESVIIATGASAKWLHVPGEEALRGRGVSGCATCDGFFFRGRRVVVIGGGDTALEEATFLTRFASNVTIIHRRDTLRASKALQIRAKADPKIDFIWNAAVEEILGDGKVTGVQIKNLISGETAVVETDGVFVAIGHQPNTEIFKGQIDLDHGGYIRMPDPATTITNIPGVFAAGDVRDHRYRQAVTAAGDGCKAAMDAERWLEEEKLALPNLAGEVYSEPDYEEYPGRDQG